MNRPGGKLHYRKLLTGNLTVCFTCATPPCRSSLTETRAGPTVTSVEIGVEWFKLSRSRAASKPTAQASRVQASQVRASQVLETDVREAQVEAPEFEPLMVEAPVIPATVAEPEPPGPIPSPALPQISVATAASVPVRSPKAVLDPVADDPSIARPVSKPKVGFTICSSRNGETHEVDLTSPTLTVAKARMLSKSGWRVQIVNTAGRQFAPSEFDDVLKFD